MKYKKIEHVNYDLYYYKTDKYKTINITTLLISDLDEKKITLDNFLSSYIVNTSKKYNDEILMNKKYIDLYNPSFSVYDIYRDHHYKFYDITFLDELYLEKGNNKKVIDFYYDSMFNTFISIISLETYSILEEDIELDFNKTRYYKKEKDMMNYLLPDMYKQARDIKPLNVIRYGAITFLSLIMALIFYGFFNYAFLGMIKNSQGSVVTFYELIFHLYFSIVATHFFMIYIDTALYNYLVIIFFFVQVIADILFVIIMNSIDND